MEGSHRVARAAKAARQPTRAAPAVAQPRINDLPCGRVSRLSLDALVNIATALGRRVNFELAAAYDKWPLFRMRRQPPFSLGVAQPYIGSIPRRSI
ncbi:MAG: hypothetical protein F9K36_17810 [Burkholderiaceae bacterium]|nr:MAG: hypothetical protein F9K36_17810 [Burkholderiaceae bacterium]